MNQTNLQPKSHHSRVSTPSIVGVVMLLCLLFAGELRAQQPYFVDGYHGGIYGHYPVEWKTGFITRTMAEHPQWRICLEIEPETWDTVAVRTPVHYRQMQELVKSPRVEFTNPTYAQPYAYNISGESLIRQFTYGIRKINQHFPDVEFVTYAVEEPCFTSALPQILTQLGYKYASLKCPNTCWGGYAAPFGGETVNWIGPDGSSILTSPRYAVEELEHGSVWQTTAWGNMPKYLEACREAGIEHPVGMCFQDAGWRNGPWIGSGDTVRANSKYVTWREYFELLGKQSGDEDYHFSQEDVRAALMWGSQVMQRIGQQVRHTEDLLPQAEKMMAMAYYLDDDYLVPQSLIDEAWRTLMLSQHHDSWIVPYNRLHGHGTWADWIRVWTRSADDIAEDIIAKAQENIAGTKHDEADEFVVVVWNTQGSSRSGVADIELPATWNDYSVKVLDCEGKMVEANVVGNRLILFADVPALGYTSYRLCRGEVATSYEEPKQDVVLENESYRIVVDPKRGGVISELMVKGDGENYVDVTSEYGMGELRGYFPLQRRFRSSMESEAKVRVGSNGSLEQWMIIEGEIASHPFTQRITLRKGSPIIDIEVRIDWQHNEMIGEFRQKNAWSTNRRACYDDRYKLSLLFPLAFGDTELDKNAPFDVCRSELDNTHFGKWDEIKHNIILNWVDVTEQGDDARSFALFTDHTTSYRYGEGEPLGLTMQYSGAGLWGRNYTLTGPTTVRCGIVPHRGEWDEAGLERLRAERSEPLLCSLHDTVSHDTVSLLDLGDSGYELTAAYPIEEGWVVRLYNASGDEQPQRVELGFVTEHVDEIDLRDNILSEVALSHTAQGSSFDVAMPRFGIRTFKIYNK